MNRRSLLTLITTAWLGAGMALAQEPYLYVQSAASTTTGGSYAVSVEVTVENRGKVASKESIVELVLKPQGKGPKSSVPTMWDPDTQTQDLPVLQPGERKSFKFQTPYLSKNTFKNVRGSFKVNNIDATGSDVSVGSTVNIKPK
ncbi:hypothetical protein IV102_03820 [bacterium]|nr:hypothetical protein [bacterium]